MYSKRILNVCVITLISSLIIVNGYSNAVTTSNKLVTQSKDNNKKPVKWKKKNGIIATIKDNINKEIAKDTVNRYGKKDHIASYLPANLPKQLIKCMENALKDNKQIKEAQQEILASHEEHNINRAALMPVISAESSTSTTSDYYKEPTKYQIGTKEYQHDKRNQFESTGALQVKYNIFHGGADIANLKSTDKSIEAKWKNYDATIQKVLSEVAQNYFTIVAKQEEIKNAQN